MNFWFSRLLQPKNWTKPISVFRPTPQIRSVMSSNHSNETASINYVAFKTKGSLTSSIGRLDAVGKYITPLAYKSGTPLKSLYEVIEIGESNVIKSGEPIALSDVKLLPPISGRDVLAVGKNYAVCILYCQVRNNPLY